MSQTDPRMIRAMRTGTLVAGCVVVAIAVLALVGWALGIETLKRVVPNAGLATMKVNTAVSLLAAGAALAIKVRSPRQSRWSLAADGLLLLPIGLGTATLIQYATGVDLRVDHLFYHDPAMTPLGHPGRAAPATVSCYAAVGLAILLIDRLTRFSQVLAILVLLTALLDLFGYLYDLKAIYSVSAFSSMALHTAMSLAMLSAGVLMLRPRRCWHALLTSKGPGGTLARRTLPATVVLPLLIGWLCLQIQQVVQFELAFAVALVSICTIVIIAGIVWGNASALDQTDAKRRHLEADRDALLEREQAARARAERALLARDQLLAIVSHELRTPLTPVLLTATALQQRTDFPPDVREDLDVIQEQVEIEARLIDDLLDLASLSQGKLQLQRERADLHVVAARVADYFRPQFEAAGVRFELQLHSRRPMVDADGRRLHQIVRHLLSNALKFTPRGGQVLCRSFDDGKQVGLQVSDSGVGMGPETLRRIFDAFEQADPTMTRRFGGLGIGLTISKMLIELHGGSLTARSAGTDQGATFELRLPRGDAAQVAAGKPDHPLAILLVDDNPQTLSAMQRLLESAGYRVTAERTAQGALAACQANRFDLLISDIGLPDQSGWELMRQLHTCGPMRGIAISGFVSDEDHRLSREAGFSVHLNKPVDLNHLLAAIDQATG